MLRHVNNDGVRGVRYHLRAVSVIPVQHVPLQHAGLKHLFPYVCNKYLQTKSSGLVYIKTIFGIILTIS